MQVVMRGGLLRQVVIIVTEGRQGFIGNIGKDVLSVGFNCWLPFQQDHERDLEGESS